MSEFLHRSSSHAHSVPFQHALAATGASTSSRIIDPPLTFEPQTCTFFHRITGASSSRCRYMFHHYTLIHFFSSEAQCTFLRCCKRPGRSVVGVALVVHCQIGQILLDRSVRPLPIVSHRWWGYLGSDIPVKAARPKNLMNGSVASTRCLLLYW
jgi:hypothetical protein